MSKIPYLARFRKRIEDYFETVRSSDPDYRSLWTALRGHRRYHAEGVFPQEHQKLGPRHAAIV